MQPKALMTKQLPSIVEQLLADKVDVHKNALDRTLTKQELIEGLQGKDALICILDDKIDSEVMDSNPNLKVIANYAVGFNNIDIAAAAERNIIVTNTPDVLTGATADMAWALLLSVSRRLVEGDRLVRSNNWSGWSPLQLLGKEVHESTLGLIGLGRIGKAVVKRAKGFDMDIIYWNRTRLSQAEEHQLGIRYGSKEEVLSQSDFVSLHLAYNNDTHHIIGRDELEKMKKTAYIINTARGKHMDEKALVEALKSGKIAGAGLDVYEHEPKVEEALLHMENVVLAPHLGSATSSARDAMGRKVAENVLAVLRGDVPPNAVNNKG